MLHLQPEILLRLLPDRHEVGVAASPNESGRRARWWAIDPLNLRARAIKSRVNRIRHERTDREVAMILLRRLGVAMELPGATDQRLRALPVEVERYSIIRGAGEKPHGLAILLHQDAPMFGDHGAYADL